MAMSHQYAAVEMSQRPLQPYSDASPSLNGSGFDLLHPNGSQKELTAAAATYGRPAIARPWYKRPLYVLLASGLLLAVILGAVLGGVLGSKDNDGKDHKSTNGNKSVVQAEDGSWGGDGSTVKMANGTEFTYRNPFGGYWVATEGNFTARTRNDSKPLSEQWDFSYDRIYGVNLGGWFVLEPFITPALFEPYAGTDQEARDEYTLSQNLGDKLSDTMTEHYSTFITEYDIATMVEAGLNWIRLPIPYWFIETREGEPFLEGVGWQYVLQVLEWCRKYGLRVELDLHAMPGSQNGQNHSGFIKGINFLSGSMGMVNAQRSLSYLRTLTEFALRPEYAPIIQVFAIGNEIAMLNIGENQVKSFYLEAYNMIRGMTGTGVGKGPMIAIHDGFVTTSEWNGFMRGADRQALETHYYLAYSPSLFITNLANDLSRPCEWWAAGVNATNRDTAFNFAGEWCLAINDCGQWINGMPYGSHYGGNYNDTATTPVGNCGDYVNYKTFSDGFKTQLQQLAYMYMDFSHNSFFWSWKMGANSTGEIPNPLWSYELGFRNGWLPADPAQSRNTCRTLPAQLGISGPASDVDLPLPLSAWMTGGSGAGEMAAAATSNFTNWPPASLTNRPTATNLWSYTPTGAVSTLSPSPTAASSASSGSDYYVPISGCSYPNAYSGINITAPTANPCAGDSQARRRLARALRPTPAPKL